MSKPKTFVGAVCFIFCIDGMTANSCIKDSPVNAVEAFYKAHKEFALKDPESFRGQVTPRFFEALSFEHQCRVGEVCAIDFDLWTGAQDGVIRNPIAFEVLSETGNLASIAVRHTFALDGIRSKKQSATVRVERQAQGQCWFVSDVVAPDGISAMRAIEEFRAKYGSPSLMRR